MKRFFKQMCLFAAMAAVSFCLSGEVCTASGTIKEGVYAGELKLTPSLIESTPGN